MDDASVLQMVASNLAKGAREGEDIVTLIPRLAELLANEAVLASL